MTRKRAATRIPCLIGAALGVIVIARTSVSHAQDPSVMAPPPAEGAVPPGAAPPGQPPPPAPLPPPPPPGAQTPPAPTPPPQTEGSSDLDITQRRVGIGYAGFSQIPYGGGTLTAPAIGVRIWINPTLGLDVALGISWAGGSTTMAGASETRDSVYGSLLHAGLPLALATRRHVSFQVIPFLASAYGRTTMTSNLVGVPNTDLTGTRFDIGVRSGFEIFWGFIGLPELSLSATVGLQFQMVRTTSQTGNLGENSVTDYGITTTVQANPWDIFTGNVAARYYF
jgi:hypothetical protein